MADVIVCKPKLLPNEKLIDAAEIARKVNPANEPARLADFGLSKQHIALLTSAYWGPAGVKLGVKFMDNPSQALKTKILLNMNAWGETANVKFKESHADAEVRIARVAGDGYWSYLGTHILTIPEGEPTMNLEGFTEHTSDAEFHRVVRHETGHTLGFPHEHMRKELVARIDEAKAIAAFGASQGWSPDEVRAQVLTPLDQRSLMGTPPDQTSIMCYQIPASLTKDNEPILGGLDINATDAAFCAKIYPKPAPV